MISINDTKCLQFLDELEKNPQIGTAIQKLSLCSDSWGYPDEPSGILTDENFKKVIKLCPNIIELDLYRCLSLTEISLKKIGKLEKLKSLGLSSCINTTDRVITSLANKPIVKLNLHNCRKITSTGFDVFQL